MLRWINKLPGIFLAAAILLTACDARRPQPTPLPSVASSDSGAGPLPPIVSPDPDVNHLPQSDFGLYPAPLQGETFVTPDPYIPPAQQGSSFAYPLPIVNPPGPRARQVLPAKIDRLPPIGDGIHTFDFVDEFHGWIATGLGWENFNDYGLLSTTDGGQRWQVLSTDGGLTQQVDFVSPSQGWRLARQVDVYNLPSLQASVDAGQSWSTQMDGAPGRWPQRMQFLDAVHGWLALAPQSLAYTQDSGKTWLPLPDLQNYGKAGHSNRLIL